jgi:prepilin-type N-terminal cleavage/methylation domain-containing protein
METQILPETRRKQGLTLIELMVVLAVLLFMVALFYPQVHRRPAVRSPRIACVNNLKQIGIAYRTFAIDNRDCFPMQTPLTNGGTLELAAFAPTYVHFQAMSNELTIPKILLCPAETHRTAATNFGPDLDNARISYFVGIDANQTNSQMFLSGDRNLTNGRASNRRFLDLTTNNPVGWTAELHQSQGNAGLADGSVQQFNNSRLREALANTGDSTNRLAMPY